MTIVEKAAYLKGLAEGLDVENSSKEGKLWSVMLELLSEMAHEIEDLQENNLDHAGALDDISEELSYLEELVCDLDMPEDFCDDCDYDGDCSSCQYCGDDEDDEDDDDDDDDDDDEDDEDDDELEYDGVIYEVTCPVCGVDISFDEDTLEEGSIVCPECGEPLEFDLDAEDEDEEKDED